MALVFPASMPAAGAERQKLDLRRVDYSTPETGGRMAGVTAGFPLWALRLTLGEMDDDDADAWRVFLASLRGSQRTFYARDLKRPYPAAYPGGFAGLDRAAGGAFPADGAATSWSLNGTRDVLTLSGLPADFALRPWDQVGFRWSTNRRALVRAVEPVTGSGAGVAAFAIEPPLPTLVPVDAVAYLASAEVVMRVVTDQTDLGDEDAAGTSGGTVTALQDLRA